MLPGPPAILGPRRGRRRAPGGDVMKTIEISPAEMELRVARFARLEPLRVAEELDMPQAAKDVIYSRKLLSVIGLGDEAGTPVNQGAPIQGAGGMTMPHAVCPPGTGPSLHAHQNTYQTFTAMKRRFEVRRDRKSTRLNTSPQQAPRMP